MSGLLQEVAPFNAPIRREGKHPPPSIRIFGSGMLFSRNNVVCQVIFGEDRRRCFVDPMAVAAYLVRGMLLVE